MTDAPIKPAIANNTISTSGHKIVNFAISSKYLLDGYATSNEEAEYKTQESSAVRRLCLVEAK